MSHPLILAFDTSGPHCAAALVQGRDVRASRFEEMSKGQAERLMPLITTTLDDDGLSLDVLDAIAVGIGPGNFTGIRIAVSAARGLALALGIPAIGVSNFEVMRGPKSRRDISRQLVSLPAPRGGHFLQLFHNGHGDGEAKLIGSLHDAYWTLFGDTETLPILGYLAGELSYFHPPTYEPEGPPAQDMAFPTKLCAQIIGAIAADKLAEGRDLPRPAPLYIKPADAAPSRETGPVIL